MPVRGSATPGNAGLSSFSEKPCVAVRSFSCQVLRAVDGEQALAQALAQDDRYVAGGVRAARDARFDLPGGDLVGDDDGVVQRGAAGARGGDRRRGGLQARGQHRLAGQIPLRGVLDHRAHGHFAQLHAVQAIAFHQGSKHFHRHAEVADIGVGGVVAAERDTYTADHTDALERVFHGWNSPKNRVLKANPPCHPGKAQKLANVGACSRFHHGSRRVCLPARQGRGRACMSIHNRVMTQDGGQTDPARRLFIGMRPGACR